MQRQFLIYMLCRSQRLALILRCHAHHGQCSLQYCGLRLLCSATQQREQESGGRGGLGCLLASHILTDIFLRSKFVVGAVSRALPRPDPVAKYVIALEGDQHM